MLELLSFCYFAALWILMMPSFSYHKLSAIRLPFSYSIFPFRSLLFSPSVTKETLQLACEGCEHENLEAKVNGDPRETVKLQITALLSCNLITGPMQVKRNTEANNLYYSKT